MHACDVNGIVFAIALRLGKENFKKPARPRELKRVFVSGSGARRRRRLVPRLIFEKLNFFRATIDGRRAADAHDVY